MLNRACPALQCIAESIIVDTPSCQLGDFLPKSGDLPTPLIDFLFDKPLATNLATFPVLFYKRFWFGDSDVKARRHHCCPQRAAVLPWAPRPRPYSTQRRCDGAVPATETRSTPLTPPPHPSLERHTQPQSLLTSSTVMTRSISIQVQFCWDLISHFIYCFGCVWFYIWVHLFLTETGSILVFGLIFIQVQFLIF